VQNYPNPFNTETVISFDLPALSQVGLYLYNIQGIEIACIAQGNFNSGHHAVRLDASHLATGLYFYKLVTSDYFQIKKMLVLR
jgi:hypothetical protein